MVSPPPCSARTPYSRVTSSSRAWRSTMVSLSLAISALTTCARLVSASILCGCKQAKVNGRTGGPKKLHRTRLLQLRVRVRVLRQFVRDVLQQHTL